MKKTKGIKVLSEKELNKIKGGGVVGSLFPPTGPSGGKSLGDIARDGVIAGAGGAMP